jgi:hypothetical protein
MLMLHYMAVNRSGVARLRIQTSNVRRRWREASKAKRSMHCSEHSAQMLLQATVTMVSALLLRAWRKHRAGAIEQYETNHEGVTRDITRIALAAYFTSKTTYLTAHDKSQGA